MRGQIAAIHALRGMAALLVVWAHLSAYWLFVVGETSALQDAWTTMVARPLHVFQDGGFLGVLIFFLISGYIVTHTSMRERRVSFAAKRLARIYPTLLLAFGLLWVLIHVMASSGMPLPFHDESPGHWLQAVLLLDGYTTKPYVLSVTWTLAVEMLFYGLVLLAVGRQRTHPLATTWAMAVTWAAACLTLIYTPALDQPTISGGQGQGLVIYVGVLLLGRCIYLAHARLSTPGEAGVLACGVAVGLAFFLEKDSPGFLLAPAGAVDTEPLIACVVALTVFIGLLLADPQRIPAPLAWLGDVSYSLYLLHLPVGFAVLTILHRLDVGNSIATLTAVGASLLAADVSYRYVEAPAQRVVRRLLDPAPVRITAPAAAAVAALIAVPATAFGGSASRPGARHRGTRPRRAHRPDPARVPARVHSIRPTAVREMRTDGGAGRAPCPVTEGVRPAPRATIFHAVP